MRGLTKFVVFSISVLLIYSAAEFVSADAYGVGHDTLTTCVFAAFGGEILSCALIKIFKLKTEDKNPWLSLDDTEEKENGEG